MAKTDGIIDLQHIVAWLIEQHETMIASGENGSLSWEMHYQGGQLRSVDFGAHHRLWERRQKQSQQ